uniref:FLZ-type domain-containing protein n=1 Tax=Aegilops tauschii subsp. strangulata TaxID=200361 RepID=A0A453SHD7_AEGTS
ITLLSGATAAVPATRARAYVHMGEEVASTAAPASLSSASSLMAAAAVKGNEERYVMVASRFFRVKPAAVAGAARHHHHFLDSCFLCKRSISRDRDIFMYKYEQAKLI